MEKLVNHSKKGVFILCLLFIFTLSSCFKSNLRYRNDRAFYDNNRPIYGYGGYRYSRPQNVRVYAYNRNHDDRHYKHRHNDRDKDNSRNNGNGRVKRESRGRR